MNADPEQTNTMNAATANAAPTDTTQTTPRWPPPPVYPPENEIDLVDLGVMLWHRRRLMLIVFLVFLALTIMATVLKSSTYAYTVTVELGSITGANGTLVSPISTSSAVSVLQNTYIPVAIAEYAQAHHTDLSGLKITAAAGAASASGNDFLTLSCKVKHKLASACVAVEQAASAKFVQANSRRIDTLQANLQAQVSRANLTLTAYQNADVFKVQQLAAQQAVTDAQNNLASLQSSAKMLGVNQAKTQASATLMQNQAAQLKGHIASVRKMSLTAAHGTSGPTEAMSNLVLATEMQDNVNLLNQIQQNLTVTLPERLATIQKNLADNRRSQALQRQIIEKNQVALKKLLFDHQQKIKGQQVTIQNLQSQLSNVVDNRVLGTPMRSSKPVGLGRKEVLALGLIISIILAIGAALTFTYVDQIRARLRTEGKS